MMLAKSAFLNNSTLKKQKIMYIIYNRAVHHYIIKKPCFLKFL